MGSHLGICLLREHAVLSSTNDNSRQEALRGQGRLLWEPGEQKMAKDRPPGAHSKNTVRGLQSPVHLLPARGILLKISQILSLLCVELS